MNECKCSMRTRLVGDGCEICNPELARDIERDKFEEDAAPYGFDLTRRKCAAPEPWSEYADPATGHRWAGWLAKSGMGANVNFSGGAITPSTSAAGSPSAGKEG